MSGINYEQEVISFFCCLCDSQKKWWLPISSFRLEMLMRRWRFLFDSNHTDKNGKSHTLNECNMTCVWNMTQQSAKHITTRWTTTMRFAPLVSSLRCTHTVVCKMHKCINACKFSAFWEFASPARLILRRIRMTQIGIAFKINLEPNLNYLSIYLSSQVIISLISLIVNRKSVAYLACISRVSLSLSGSGISLIWSIVKWAVNQCARHVICIETRFASKQSIHSINSKAEIQFIFINTQYMQSVWLI